MARRAPKCTRCKTREAAPFDRKALAARLDAVIAHLANAASAEVHYRYGYAASTLLAVRADCDTLCSGCRASFRDELDARL